MKRFVRGVFADRYYDEEGKPNQFLLEEDYMIDWFYDEWNDKVKEARGNLVELKQIEVEWKELWISEATERPLEDPLYKGVQLSYYWRKEYPSDAPRIDDSKPDPWFSTGYHIPYVEDNSVERLLRIYIDEAQSNTDDKNNTSPNSNLKWNGEKVEVCELIQALWASGKILDQNTGKKITKPNLIKVFEHLFNDKYHKLDDLLRGSYTAYNHRLRINTLKSDFLDSLGELLEEDKQKREDRQRDK